MDVGIRFASALGVVAIVAGCSSGGSDDQQQQPPPRPRPPPAPAALPGGNTVELTEVGGSGQSGTATLTQVGQSTRVVIELRGASAGAQPARVLAGTCDNPGAIEHRLADVENGTSSTTVPTPLHVLRGASDAAYAIEVHESAGTQTPVACGTVSHGLPEPQLP